MPATEDDKKKFADYIKLHALEKKALTREQEKRVLQDGIMEFDLSYDEARAILMSVCHDNDLVLERVEDDRLRDVLAQFATKKGYIRKQDFDDVLSISRKFYRGALSDEEIRRNLKRIAEENNIKPKRHGWVLRSRKWFTNIET